MALSRSPSSRMMPQTLSTSRKVFVDSGGGANTIQHTPILSGVRASIQDDASPEAQVAAAIRGVRLYRVYIDSGQDVKQGDVFTYNGVACEITSIQDLSGRLTVTQLIAESKNGISL